MVCRRRTLPPGRTSNWCAQIRLTIQTMSAMTRIVPSMPPIYMTCSQIQGVTVHINTLYRSRRRAVAHKAVCSTKLPRL